MQKKVSQKFILFLFTLAILFTRVYTCAYLNETANFEIAADNSVQEIRKVEGTHMNPILRTEHRVISHSVFVPVRTTKRQGISSIYRTILGLVLVEYAPLISNSFSEFMESQYYLIQTSLDSLIQYVQGQDGKK